MLHVKVESRGRGISSFSLCLLLVVRGCSEVRVIIPVPGI